MLLLFQRRYHNIDVSPQLVMMSYVRLLRNFSQEHMIGGKRIRHHHMGSVFT